MEKGCVDGGVRLGHKQERSLAMGSDMGGPVGIVIRGISQTEEEKYHMIPLIYGIQRTKLMNKTETDSDTGNKLMVARWGEVGGTVKRGEGIEKN